MEDRPRKSKAWIVVLVILGLLGSCLVGVLAGGVAGYAFGRKSVMRMMGPSPWMMPEWPWKSAPEIGPDVPMPDLELPESGFLQGALIIWVAPDSPAEEAGLRVGDLIVSVHGVPLDGEQELGDLIAKFEPKEKISIWIRPVDEPEVEREIRVTLGRNPDLGGETAWLGIEYENIE